SLAAVAERAASAGYAGAAGLIESGATKLSDAGDRLRVQAALVAVRGEASGLEASLGGLRGFADAGAYTIPDLPVLIQKDLPDRSQSLTALMAAGELLRSALILKNAEGATAAMAEVLRQASAAAPPTGAARDLLQQIRSDEAAVRKRIQTELRESDAGRLGTMYRTSLNRAGSLAQAAEDRRSLLVLLLCRAASVGGAGVVRQALKDSAELKAELLLDELRGLPAIAALAGGDSLPELGITEPATAAVAPRSTLSQMLVDLGRAAGAAAALEGVRPGDALQWLEQGVEPLPTLRAALALESVWRMGGSADVPALLGAVSNLRNGIWREEGFEAAGLVLGDRGLGGAVRDWSAAAKISAQEQIALGYGLGLSQLRALNATAAKSE
ncbi:MAG: hypothetical protein RL215_1368, partial [Planctomycetota bacterium]